MATDYTSTAEITLLAGQLAVTLRTDDGVAVDILQDDIDYGTAEVDFYCARYSQVVLADNKWIRKAATLFGLEWLCTHRLNQVPDGVATLLEELRKKLELVRQGTADVPRAPSARLPGVVTNYTVDTRRPNNQVRVDRTRSTGTAAGYVRPVDPGAEMTDSR